MDYRDTLDAIERTEHQARQLNAEAKDLRRFFRRYGCHDEHAVDELTERRNSVYSALHQLYAKLPTVID